MQQSALKTCMCIRNESKYCKSSVFFFGKTSTFTNEDRTNLEKMLGNSQEQLEGLDQILYFKIICKL